MTSSGLINTVDDVDAITGVTLKERAQMALATLGRTPLEINRSFRRLAKSHHPDARGGDALKFKLINEAYQLLTKGRLTKSPLLADDELVLQVAGRRAAPLLDMQKEWAVYNRWHEKKFHDGDWFYPTATDSGRSGNKSTRRSATTRKRRAGK